MKTSPERLAACEAFHRDTVQCFLADMRRTVPPRNESWEAVTARFRRAYLAEQRRDKANSPAAQQRAKATRPAPSPERPLQNGSADRLAMIADAARRVL